MLILSHPMRFFRLAIVYDSRKNKLDLFEIVATTTLRSWSTSCDYQMKQFDYSHKVARNIAFRCYPGNILCKCVFLLLKEKGLIILPIVWIYEDMRFYNFIIT